MRNRSPFFRRLLAVAMATVMAVNFSGCGKKKEPIPEQTVGTSVVTESTATPLPDFKNNIKNAKQKNSDVIGWLNIPDTEINDAVLQTTDNDYYHRKDENKQYSWTGCYYADYESNLKSRGELSKNNVIYGHNVHYDDNKEKERFSQLFHYTDLEFVKTHPYIYFYLNGKDPELEENKMVWEVFSVFYTTTDFDYIQVKKDITGKSSEELSDAQLMNIVNEAKARSEYTYNVEVSGSDKILTLSTCSYKFGRRNDVRFVVMAKLLEPKAELKPSIEVKENKSKKDLE